MLKDVVSGRGTWRVKVGKVYCSVGTPLLRVRGVRPGDRLKVTVSFQARAKKAGRGGGARFRIDPSGPVNAIADAEGCFEGHVGWHNCSLTGYYSVRGRSSEAVENVAFDVLFGNGGKGPKAPLDGRARIREFLMSAELV